MGVLAPGSAHARPSARPPLDTSGNFSGTNVCRVTFKHLPQPLICHIRSFGTIGQLLKEKKNRPRGWGNELHFPPRIFVIFISEPMQKFKT
jgi:hypothetical protein